jgi:hypothetical protein
MILTRKKLFFQNLLKTNQNLQNNLKIQTESKLNQNKLTTITNKKQSKILYDKSSSTNIFNELSSDASISSTY